MKGGLENSPQVQRATQSLPLEEKTKCVRFSYDFHGLTSIKRDLMLSTLYLAPLKTLPPNFPSSPSIRRLNASAFSRSKPKKFVGINKKFSSIVYPCISTLAAQQLISVDLLCLLIFKKKKSSDP